MSASIEELHSSFIHPAHQEVDDDDDTAITGSARVSFNIYGYRIRL